MSVRPNDVNNDDDTTMLEALNTAAALAAAAMGHSEPRESARTLPPILSATAPVSETKAPITVKSIPVTLLPTNVAAPTVPMIVPSPMPPSQAIPSHSFLSYVSPTCGTQIVPPQPPMQHLTHLLFQPDAAQLGKMKLRRGKWTVEEEAYAELLIQEFECGQLEGCENGCTLRAFLSKQLHCAPMRISKKFAGKSIGKHVFLSRASVNPSAVAPAIMTCNKAKLLDLEAKFYKSLCRESETVPYVTTYPGGAMLIPAPNQVVVPCAPAAFLSFPQPFTQPSNQVCQNFVSALRHQTGLPSSVPAPILPAPPRVSPTPVTTMTLSAPSHQQPTGPVSKDVTPRHLIPQPMEQQMKGERKPESVISSSSDPPSAQDELSSTAEMPDFLSGFDKVSAQRNGLETLHHEPRDKKVVANCTPVFQSQYSPPFTSRSFDDLHRHLGEGLSPGPLDLNYPEFPSLPFDVKDGIAKAKDPNLSSHSTLHVNADSYATFAQESVHAVSQHSAYLRPVPTHVVTKSLFIPAIVNAENLRAHSLVSGNANIVSFRDHAASEWGAYTTATESVGVVSGSDNASDTPSNDADSDSNYDDGPQQKKVKIDSEP